MNARPEVLVFTMEGCPACMSLKPLARMLGTHYGRCVETRFVDVGEHEGLADAMRVDQTPTVIGVDANKQPAIRMVGHNGDPNRLQRVYDTLVQGAASCQIRPFRDI